MNCKYTIKNFRVFDEKGSTLNLRPISVLTGCNSSGKSSLAKSNLLLNDFFNDIKNTYISTGNVSVSNIGLDFNSYRLNLGDFNSVINKRSKIKTITFEYETLSCWLGENVFVELAFTLRDDDIYNKGWLSAIKLKDRNHTCIFSCIINSKFLSISYVDYDYFAQRFENYILCFLNCYKKFYNHSFCENSPLANRIDSSGNSPTNFAVIKGYDFVSFYSFLASIKDKDLKSYIDYLMVYLPHNLHFNFDSLRQYIIEDYDLKSIVRHIKNERLACSSKYIGLSIDSLLNTIEESKPVCLNQFLKLLQDTYQKSKSECKIGLDKSNDFPTLIKSAISIKHVPVNISSEEIRPEKSNKKNKREFENEIALGILSKMFEVDHKIGCFNMFELTQPYCVNLWNQIADFIGKTLKDILKNESAGQFSYHSSNNLNVQRFYANNGSRSTFYELIQDYYKTTYFAGDKTTQGIFVNKWIRKLGIGERISVDTIANGDAVVCKLYLDKNDVTGHFVSDLGYGVCQILSSLIQIETVIIKKSIKANQSIIKEIYEDRFQKDDIFATNLRKMLDEELATNFTVFAEEPEAHLHPKFQSALAEVYVDAFVNYHVQFIIETHSEYLIRKLQSLVAQKKLKCNDTIIYYMYDPKQDDIPDYIDKVKEIRINEDGSLTDSFGSGFFDESYNLSNELLKVKLGML